MQILFKKFSEEDILISAGIPVHEEVPIVLIQQLI
jgi:hypothetical protein